MDAYTDEEVERCFEEFYEDVHTEFLKFGEIVNFKVCKNGSFHLRGNVYVQYESLDSALAAYNSINGRYFAGKQVRCEFVNVTRWKVAICGEYMKSGFKTCSHGTACNFIHCFRNPGGDYEWADFDKPPPKYWIKNMAALFGSSDDHEKLTERETLSVLKNSSKKLKTDSDKYHSRRSRYREMDCFDSSGYGRRKLEHERKRSRPPDEEICEQNTKLKDNHKRKSRTSDTDSDTEWLDEEGNREKRRKHSRKSSTNRNKDDERRSGYGRRKQNRPDEEICEQNTNLKDNHKRKDRTSDTDFDMECLDEEGDREKQRKRTSKSSTSRNKDDERRSHEEDSDVDWAAIPGDREKQHGSDGRNSRQRNWDIDEAGPDGDCSDRDRDRKRHHTCKRKKSSHRSRDYRNLNSETESDRSFFDGDGDMETHHYSSRKSSKHRRSGFPDDYKDYENRNDEDRRSHHHDPKSSSKHKKKLEYFDDHGDECKSRLQERVV